MVAPFRDFTSTRPVDCWLYYFIQNEPSLHSARPTVHHSPSVHASALSRIPRERNLVTLSSIQNTSNSLPAICGNEGDKLFSFRGRYKYKTSNFKQTIFTFIFWSFQNQFHHFHVAHNFAREMHLTMVCFKSKARKFPFWSQSYHNRPKIASTSHNASNSQRRKIGWYRINGTKRKDYF